MTGHTLLLRALRMNAIFSASSAVLLFPGARWLAEQLGLPSAVPIYITAGLLLLFALQLANIVRTAEIRTAEVATIIGADLAWVLGSAVFVFLFYSSISMTGLVLIDAIAIVVLYFAIQQARGLRAFRQRSGIR